MQASLHCAGFLTTKLSSAMPMGSVRRRPRRKPAAWTPCLAERVTPPVTFLPTASFILSVQFPLSCGNVRQQRFIDIWRHSEQLKRGPIDLPEGSVELLAVRAWLDLHSLPGSRVPGGKCARTFHGGLREVLCPHRYPVSESSGEKREDLSAASGADSTGSRNRW